jgi:hypothetical protein
MSRMSQFYIRSSEVKLFFMFWRVVDRYLMISRGLRDRGLSYFSLIAGKSPFFSIDYFWPSFEGISDNKQ